MSAYTSNGEKNYAINGIDITNAPVDQYIIEQKPNQLSSQNSYYFHPPSSPYNDFHKHSPTSNSNYQNDSLNINSTVANNPNLVACLSSRSYPPASDLIPLSNTIDNSASVRMLPDARQFSGGSLPSISSLGQKQPMTPLLHNQPQQSPSIPPSPYINTPSTYYSLTEPGTPATQIFNTLDHNIQASSPSLSNNPHISNPPSIMSSVPPSPASISNLQKSPSVKNIRVTSTPDYSHQQNDQYTSGQALNNNSELYHNRSQSVQYIVHQTKNLPASSNYGLTTAKTRTYKSPNYQSRGRGKNSTISSILQMRGPGSSSAVPFSDDGPTVKEHLQQQQARNKMQQEILTKKLYQEEDKKGGRKSKTSTSVSPQKSFLQPVLQHQSTSYSPETIQYDSGYVGSNVRYITGVSGGIHSQQLSAAPPHPPSTFYMNKRGNVYAPASYNSSIINNNVAMSNVSVNLKSNTNNDEAGSQNFNDTLASTIASVASGASGSLEPDDFLDSSIELNLPSPTSKLFVSGSVDNYSSKNSVASISNKVETKYKNSLSQNHDYYVQTTLNSVMSPLNYSNSVVSSSKVTTTKGRRSQNTKSRHIPTAPAVKQHLSQNAMIVYPNSLTPQNSYSTQEMPQEYSVSSNNPLIIENGSSSTVYSQPEHKSIEQKQCTRIHVQNPPNAMGCSFPPTETTIHVVQQPRYQDSTRYNSYQYSGNSVRNAQYKTSKDVSQNIISVHQHPSVPEIQQQDKMDSDRVHHIIVQQQKSPTRQYEVAQNQRQVYTVSPSTYLNKQQNYSNSQLQSQNSKTTIPHGNNSTQRQYITGTIQGQKTNPNVTLQSSPSYPVNSHKTLYQPRQPDCIQTQIIQNNTTAHPEAENLGNQNNDVEFRKYAIKQYHLQRTIKALVYKNGALADEIARLNQRIQIVTNERRACSKRLQHHERNRIRRIQTQHRKAAAAAAAAARKLVAEMMLDSEFSSKTSSSYDKSIINEKKFTSIKDEIYSNDYKPTLNHMALTPIGINTTPSELNDFDDSLSYVSSAVDVPFTRSYSLASDSTFLPIQTHIKVEINAKEPSTECLPNKSGEFLHNTLTVDDQNTFEVNLNNTNDSISPLSQSSNTGLVTNMSGDSVGRATRHSVRQQQLQQERMERKRKQDQLLQTPKSASRSSSISKKSNSISPKAST